VYFFNILLEKVARNSGIETIGTTYNKTIQVLAHVDGIVSVWRPTSVVKEQL
jgi:hypothetical protein